MSRFCFFLLFSLGLFQISVGQWDPNFVPGHSTIVHLFEWRWDDISAECTRFLGPIGYGGVQVSPPNENVVIQTDRKRPWYERYQPVSYKLETRSGNEEQFKAMVKACNEAGVRIYVDAVINHMSGQGYNSASGKNATGGSEFSTAAMNYPGVPYNTSDFNSRQTCPSASGEIDDYTNAIQVRNCKLSGLNDLNQNNSHVQEMLLEYMNRVISYGVAGFRIDAAKHMWPEDLKILLAKLNNLSEEHGFAPGTRPFIYQEVIDLGFEAIKSSDYTPIGRVTEFKYGKYLGDLFRKNYWQQLSYMRNFGEGWAMIKNLSSLVFIDNHDNQRGHGAGGINILTFRVPRLYKQANAFMLALPYGITQVMSSYWWDQNMVSGKDLNDFVGPPHDAAFNILSVPIKNDGSCDNGWICEHRWPEIYEMVKFRNIVSGTIMNNWWDNGKNQIAFSRGKLGFIAMNNDIVDLNTTIQTGLPVGLYCDVISGGLDTETGYCLGKMIEVGSDGKAFVFISRFDEVPVIAIHAQSKLSNLFYDFGPTYPTSSMASIFNRSN